MVFQQCGTHPVVNESVAITIAHTLGKAEAVRRLKDGLARGSNHLGPILVIEQETWEGDTLRFQLRALGQAASGRIDVMENAMRVEVSLPWLLAKAAKRLLPILRRETTQLLEKK